MVFALDTTNHAPNHNIGAWSNDLVGLVGRCLGSFKIRQDYHRWIVAPGRGSEKYQLTHWDHCEKFKISVHWDLGASKGLPGGHMGIWGSADNPSQLALASCLPHISRLPCYVFSTCMLANRRPK